MGWGRIVSKLHIEYVRNAVDERYAELIDLSVPVAVTVAVRAK